MAYNILQGDVPFGRLTKPRDSTTIPLPQERKFFSKETIYAEKSRSKTLCLSHARADDSHLRRGRQSGRDEHGLGRHMRGKHGRTQHRRRPQDERKHQKARRLHLERRGYPAYRTGRLFRDRHGKQDARQV